MKIEKGVYVRTNNIPDTKTWKQCIDAFKQTGAKELEGYTSSCSVNYSHSWQKYDYLTISKDTNLIIHWNSGIHKYTEVTVEQLLSTLEEPTMNEFKKEDLKTGMRITEQRGRVGIIFKDVDHGYSDQTDFIVYVSDGIYGYGWNPIPDISNVIKVEKPDHPYSFTYGHLKVDKSWGYKTVWEKNVLSPAEIEKEAIKAEMDKLSKRLSALEVK